MIQCAVGDADPARPGDELVAVGMKAGTEGGGGPGEAHLVYREGDAWRTETIFEDVALLHGVGVGEIDPDHEGAEVLVVGFSNDGTVLGRTADGPEVDGVARHGPRIPPARELHETLLRPNAGMLRTEEARATCVRVSSSRS